MNCPFTAPPSNPLMQLLESARECVDVIEPTKVVHRLDQWLVLDVREPTEILHGYLPFAVNVPRGQLEFRITQPPFFDRSRAVLVYSNKGRRSMLAGMTLVQLGFSNVHSLAGGIAKWITLDLPLE